MSATKTSRIDKTEIVRALNLYTEGPFEIRIPEATMNGRSGVAFGYFDNAALAADAVARVQQWAGVYFTANPIDPALLSRRNNRIALAGKKDATTSDTNIIRRRWLLIDADPIRPTGISSTDAEHAAALERIEKINLFLAKEGWPEGIVADSGNGGHLTFRIDEPADDGGLVERVLTALDQLFTDAVVKVDTGVFNPARIWKLPGTLACKGDSTPARPWRTARIISAPASPTLAGNMLLRHIAGQAKSKTLPASLPKVSVSTASTFDVAAWLAKHEPAAGAPESWSGGQKWRLAVCPFNSAHTDGDAAVFQASDGKPGFSCFHNSCQSYGWKEYRAQREPAYRDRQDHGPRHATPNPADPGQTIEDYGVEDATTTTGDAANTPVDDAPTTTALAFEDAADLIRDYPEPRPYVLEGLLREREIMNFVSSSKVGKTWGMNDLALCMTTGRAWLSRFAVARGDVLYIDAELHRQTISYRLRAISRARGILPTEYAGHLKILSLRGRLRTIPELEPTIRALEPGRFKAIFIDSLYRVWPAGMDENSNAHVTAVYNTLDRWAELTGAAIICVHHASKGNQSSKAVADVGSGAGAQSRAADTHLVLRAHEQEDAAVLECVARSSPPLSPVGIRWKLPTWFVDPTLDVDRLREPGQKATGNGMTPAAFADRFLNGEAISKNLLMARAAGGGLSESERENLFVLAMSDGLIDVRGDEKDGRKKLYFRTQSK